MPPNSEVTDPYPYSRITVRIRQSRRRRRWFPAWRNNFFLVPRSSSIGWSLGDGEAVPRRRRESSWFGSSCSWLGCSPRVLGTIHASRGCFLERLRATIQDCQANSACQSFGSVVMSYTVALGTRRPQKFRSNAELYGESRCRPAYSFGPLGARCLEHPGPIWDEHG